MTVAEATGTAPAELEAFRQRCRAFLQEHATGVPPAPGGADDRGAHALAVARELQRRLTEAGLAGLTYPKEHGGQGLTTEHERVWRDEAARFPLMTTPLAVSHGMCTPVLAEFGTPEQKARYLAKLISAEEVWCQLFSEPGAGSDVASLQARAVRDGDEWVLDGQKVWTTMAHLSDRGIVLARTDAMAPGGRVLVTPSGPSTPASPCSSSTCGRRGWRCGRSTRSTAGATSTRCSSPACASLPTT